MSGSTAQVFSFVKQKDDYGNFYPLYLSPEQRYVKPTRKSNNNNLEEQLLFGMDRIITTWTEENSTIRQHIEFRSSEDPTETGYYIIDSYIYDYQIGDMSVSSEDPLGLEVFIENGHLVFDQDDICSFVDNILVDDKGEGFMNLSDTDNALAFFPFYIIRKDYLRFKKDNGDILDVSQKITTTDSSDANKMITKEIITNLL